MSRETKLCTSPESLTGFFGSKKTEYAAKSYVDVEVAEVYGYVDKSIEDVLNRVNDLDDANHGTLTGLMGDRTRHNAQIKDLREDVKRIKQYFGERIRFLESYVSRDPYYATRTKEIDDEIDIIENGPKSSHRGKNYPH